MDDCLDLCQRSLGEMLSEFISAKSRYKWANLCVRLTLLPAILLWFDIPSLPPPPQDRLQLSSPHFSFHGLALEAPMCTTELNQWLRLDKISANRRGRYYAVRCKEINCYWWPPLRRLQMREPTLQEERVWNSRFKLPEVDSLGYALFLLWCALWSSAFSVVQRRPSPSKQMMHIAYSPYFHKIYKFPYFINIYISFGLINFFCSTLFSQWCIFASCFPRTGRPWRRLNGVDLGVAF